MSEGYLERARAFLQLLREKRDEGEALARELEERTRRGEERELELRRVAVEGLGELRVLTLPSVFAPEDWGRTFLRGLLLRPPEMWRGKTIVELGCGSGWVAVALARFTPVTRVHALDLNPHAALVAEINARLAGVEDRIEVGVSDLLGALEERDISVDLVCGNIPQALGPAEVERASALGAPGRVLRLLADYAPPTGNYEDVLSLGLIANALERALPRLKPEGRIVLNLAGRPGFDAIRWVFARWGYVPRVLLRARIAQDPGTDIEPFARAEEATGRAFRFYATREAREPIGAREAIARRGRGEPLFHDLYVVEGRPYRHVAADGARRYLALGKRIPYTVEPGDELEGLREEACVYLSCFLGLRPTPDEVFVAPTASELVRAVALATCDDGDEAVVDPALATGLGALRAAGLKVRVADGPIESVVGAARLVVATLGTRERPGELSGARLEALEKARMLVIDASFAPIASLRNPAGRVEGLDGIWRRGAVVFVDLGEHLALGESVVVALTGPELRRALLEVGDATWSRAPLVPQVGAKHLLATLNERYRGPRPSFDSRSLAQDERRSSSALARELALLPAFLPVPGPPPGSPRERVIRLDFGESEFPVSERLRRGVEDGLAAPDRARVSLEDGARAAAAHWLVRSRERLGAKARVDASEVVLAAGAQPLIAATIELARARGGGATPLVVLPRPFYGMFPAVVLAARAELAPVAAVVDTNGRLLLDEDEIRFRLDRAHGRGAVLLLANPNNPTGCYLEREALAGALALARERKALALVDEVFFALRHSPRGEPPASALELGGEGTIVLEGLSKAFAAGGLRLGIAWAPGLASELAGRVARPGAPALGAARAQLADFEADLDAHVAWLRERARRTLAVTRELGLEAVVPEAGLFLSLDFTPFEERAWSGTDVWGGDPGPDRPSPEDFRETLAAAAGLVVSPDHWSGWALPHRRIVFSIEDLETALLRLRAFATVLDRAEPNLESRATP